MPGLTVERELKLLEEKVEKLTYRILNSKSVEEQKILTEEFHEMINKICILFKILNPCLD